MKNVQDDPSLVDAPTRERVATVLLERGASTVAALADELDLTPAAIRRHLDHMLADGDVVARDPRPNERGGRGRPAKVFGLSDAGRDRFAQAYDQIAVDALRFLVEQSGDEAVLAFARSRMAEQGRRYAARLNDLPTADRPEVLAEALSEDGYAASAESIPAGVQICQHHCPVAHVAEEFPALCEAETEMFSRLVGTHVQRLATIAHGDGVCTTHVPATHVPAAHVPAAHVPAAHVPAAEPRAGDDTPGLSPSRSARTAPETPQGRLPS